MISQFFTTTLIAQTSEKKLILNYNIYCSLIKLLICVDINMHPTSYKLDV